jgi:hypothetical protein
MLVFEGDDKQQLKLGIQSAIWNVAETETLASPSTVHCDHVTSNAPIFWLICGNRPLEIK